VFLRSHLDRAFKIAHASPRSPELSRSSTRPRHDKPRKRKEILMEIIYMKIVFAPHENDVCAFLASCDEINRARNSLFHVQLNALCTPSVQQRLSRLAQHICKWNESHEKIGTHRLQMRPRRVYSSSMRRLQDATANRILTRNSREKCAIIFHQREPEIAHMLRITPAIVWYIAQACT